MADRRRLRRLAGFATTLVLGAAAVSASLLTSASTASAVATIYTVTNTWGPFSGTAAPGWPGGVRDGEAYNLACNAPRDALLGGSAVINHKTSHGTTDKDVLNLDRIGAYYDSDALYPIHWGAFLRPNGRPGWNTATLTITCLVRRG